jgi:2-polyprenyl-3-methyl-5-hydroxy-6-metoxy-1,4-benzoquinol methylase
LQEIELARIDEIMNWVKGPKVLDVGCTGHNLEIDSPFWLHGRLRQQFPRVIGIDISSQNINILRENGFDDVYVQSAEDFDVPEKFDTIVTGELIEHLANPGLFLQRAKAHLAEKGRIVLTTPYPFSLAYTLYALFNFPKTCQNLEHTCWLCPQTLKSLAERYGLKVMHFELLEDHRPDAASRRYRAFVKLVTWLRPLLPIRLKNKTMLFVLVPDENLSTS